MMIATRRLAAPAMFALVACGAACGSSDVERPPPPPVDPRIYQQPATRAAVVHKTPFETERESLDAFGRAFAAADAGALSSLFDADADMSYPGMPDATDRNELLASMSQLFGSFTSRKYAASRIWMSGEAAIVEWSMTAAQTGDFLGIKATGKEVGLRGVTLYWFNLSGLINDMHVYFDAGATVAQLGGALPCLEKPSGAGPKGCKTPIEGPPVVLAASPQVFVAAGGSEEEKADLHALNASFDALEAKNENEYLAPFADDVDVFRLDRPAPERGKEDRRKFARTVARAFSSLAQNPINAWGIGAYAIEEYTITGVNSGPIAGIQPTGHAVRLHVVDIAEMTGGKIVHLYTFGNSLELFAEIGAIPKAAP
jgi:predicted ester cyclase